MAKVKRQASVQPNLFGEALNEVETKKTVITVKDEKREAYEKLDISKIGLNASWKTFGEYIKKLSGIH